MWRKFYDGWFEYYYNIETGEKKFKLDPGDILVDNGHMQIIGMKNSTMY